MRYAQSRRKDGSKLNIVSMNKNVTSNAPQQEVAVCTQCKKPIHPKEGEAKGLPEQDDTKGVKGDSTDPLLCDECQLAAQKRKKKRKLAVVASAAAVLLFVSGAGWWYLSQTSARRTALGFGGVSDVKDSVRIQVGMPEKVELSLASATLASTPVSAQAPISNIEDFQRAVAETTDAAKTAGSNALSVPAIALQFQIGSDQISSSTSEMITELVKLFKGSNQKAGIIIEGFACNLGGKALNDNISHQRAEAVKAALISEGISPDKIEVHWYGKSRNKEFKLPSIAAYRRVLVSFQ